MYDPQTRESEGVHQSALRLPAQPIQVQLRDTIYNAALLTFGKKQAKTADCFEVHLDDIQLFIDEKRRALASYKSSPSEKTLKMLRAARSKVQQISKCCANDFGFNCAITHRSVLTKAI